MVCVDKNDRRKTKLTLVNRNQTKNFPQDTKKDSSWLSVVMKKKKKRERRFFPLRKRKQKEDIKWSFCKRMVKRHRLMTAQNLGKTRLKITMKS